MEVEELRLGAVGSDEDEDEALTGSRGNESEVLKVSRSWRDGGWARADGFVGRLGGVICN